MTITMLPRDADSLAFDMNCAILPAADGYDLFIRQVSPSVANPTRPVSTIVHQRVSRDFRRWTSERRQLLWCNNTTALLYHYEDPRVIPNPAGGTTLSACTWGGQYFEDNVNFHTAGHQLLCQLNVDFEVIDTRHPVHGYNGVSPLSNLRHEKNWVPFYAEGRLHFIYHCTPHHVFHEVDEYDTKVYRTDGPKWNYGQPSPSTPPVDLGDGTSLVFFHSFLTDGMIRTYHVGAYVMENREPFRVLRCTTRPLVTGDPRHTVIGFERQNSYFLGSTAPSSHKLHHAVMFPCGVVRDGDLWHLSSGVNDIAAGIITLETKEIEVLL